MAISIWRSAAKGGYTQMLSTELVHALLGIVAGNIGAGDMCIDTRIDMRIDMCIDTRIDMQSSTRHRTVEKLSSRRF